MMTKIFALSWTEPHFGHRRSLVSPRSKSFIFAIKNSVALINLEETQRYLSQAQKVIAKYRAENKAILFVGTKRAARNIVKTSAESIGAAYINERWFGGFLTNFSGILENIRRIDEREEYLASDESKNLSKAERLREQNKLNKSLRFLQGVRSLKAAPDLLVLASASEDAVAIKEANQLNVPIIAIVDTDIDPQKITYPIPANDDAPAAVELILRSLVSKTEETVKPKTPAVKLELAEVEAKPVKKTPVKKAAKPKLEKSATVKPKVAVNKVAAKKAVPKAKSAPVKTLNKGK